MANGHGEKLTRKQEQAIVALLNTTTLIEAAAQVAVDEKTLRRWLVQPLFLAAYRQARLQVVEGAIGRLQAASGEAVTTLRECLNADKAGDRVRAAVAILDHCHRGAELCDLAGQVAELKRQVEELKHVHISPVAGSESDAEEPAGQQGAADAPAGEDSQGPDGDPGGGGDGGGPLAGGGTPLFG
jgi:hypothetical protein